jgi:CheY-like chemotaxis protein/two-component sensor histidine kinase
MSHEIRTPINGILGFANLMEMREFTREKEIQYLQIINSSGKLLLNLINDIIDIAKIEAGEIKIESASVDINALLTDLRDFYQGEKIRRSKNHIEIRISIPVDTSQVTIETDPFRLRQVINNLISNSLKFTDKGYVEFGYSIEKSKILFFVRDTGIGMTKEDSFMVFERFKQVGCASKKKEGTGLGLAISRGLVEILGGEIWAKSSPNEGSEFYFTIPLSESKQLPAELIQEKTVPVKNYSWTGKTLLLVEDEEVNYLYINELLSYTGINLLHVITAEEAIKICKSSQHLDLILMDMRLPGINGFDATRLIKRIRKNVPIIAQTAYAMENERKHCLEAGCDHYMTKPFDQEILFTVLDSYLQCLN